MLAIRDESRSANSTSLLKRLFNAAGGGHLSGNKVINRFCTGTELHTQSNQTLASASRITPGVAFFGNADFAGVSLSLQIGDPVPLNLPPDGEPIYS